MKTEPNQASNVPSHILLTSLGMQAKETTYQWEGREAEACLTPLALVQLLDSSQRPDRVFAMVTEGAREITWPDFRNGIYDSLRFEPTPIHIPNGRTNDEIREILESVAQNVPQGSELTLDVTQGFRHFPFIFYALVLYLTSLHDVKIRGVYYGMFDTPGDKKPIIDLQPLLELPQWFYAVRMFRDQGTTLPMARLLKPLLEPLATTLNQEAENLPETDGRLSSEAIKLRTQARQVKNVPALLEKHAFAYESALPLELGKISQELIEPIEKLAVRDFDGRPPLAGELTAAIIGTAKKSAFAKAPSSKGKWKNNVSLSQAELDRQAGMIDLYLERGQLPLAVGLMREWVVSWAVLQSGGSVEDGRWLDRTVRLRHERRLGALGAFARATTTTSLTEDQKELGDFWNQLADSLRNALHHHAMREDPLDKAPAALQAVQCFWDKLKSGEISLPLLGGGGGKLLISPQGTKPGVLFSALQVAGPDSCLVICSDASAKSIGEAIRHAAFEGPCEQIRLDDPQGGFGEFHTAVAQVRNGLLEADEVIANMTGGTTLMGLVVQRLAEEAQKLDRPVRRFALIDRRSPAEQNDNPFVEGECHWLDPERA